MREILFRGKREGKWIEGSLVRFPDGTTEICYSGEKCDIDELDKATVETETVGQFTGRIDKNGKKVFEHDILQILDGVARGIVQWWENDQCYVLETKEGWHIDDFGNYGRPECYEVIGNIHDNPELLSDSE